MKRYAIPPVEILRKHFRIDSHGRLERHFESSGWKLAARIRSGGRYFTVPFQGKLFLAHRLIWAMHYGTPPLGDIDHINGNKWDNRIENLRDVSHAQNQWNVAPKKQNKSGYPNVHKVVGGYEARLMVNYRLMRSPVFKNAELVGLIADVMRRRFHGEWSWSARA